MPLITLVYIAIAFIIGAILSYLILKLKTDALKAENESKTDALKVKIAGINNDLEKALSECTKLKTDLINLNKLYNESKSFLAGTESQLNGKTLLLQDKENQLADSLKTNKKLIQENTDFQKQIAKLQADLNNEQSTSKEKLALLENAQEKLTQVFQNAANEIIDNKSKKISEQNKVFTDQNKAALNDILTPLKERIKEFDKKVTDTYDKEAAQRTGLKFELEQLKKLNMQMSTDAINLTNALKNDPKTQGNWGELILEDVLKLSGLRKGHEYHTQESYRNESEKLLMTDVVVHLPDGKDVILDSKVSLTAYERYHSSDNVQEKEIALKEHLQSIKNHIKNLDNKNYKDLLGDNKLDYVLLFIPIEPAFILAIDKDINLFEFAFKNNIILVCPSTLLASLRTINNIWKYELQSKNAVKIADQASKLYDKFVGFIEEMNKLGKTLVQAQSSYNTAFDRLKSGRGNLITQSENLIKLGVKANKRMPSVNNVELVE